MTTAHGRLRQRLGDDRGSVTVWAISATVASVLLVGLVLDGGAMLRARSDAFGLASAAARAGAQQLDSAAAVEGTAILDPVAARQAAFDFLAARGATGTVTITGDTITVTVTSSVDLQLLSLAGGDTATFAATATVDAVKVDLP